ncbi:MAG TPA: 50S ribosomal protein L17 [Steroidobacteraceae bacterium]|nr:50S ribosomal protein L17 [Steroidobacteraceae bacterium]
MRHRVAGRKFDRNTGHRIAMFKNLVTDLLRYEQIQTTEQKAKEIRGMAERIITLGKDGTVHARRQALRFVTDKDVVDRVFTVYGPRYAARPGGYTRILKLGQRLGDGASIAIIELIGSEKASAASPASR